MFFLAKSIRVEHVHTICDRDRDVTAENRKKDESKLLTMVMYSPIMHYSIILTDLMQ